MKTRVLCGAVALFLLLGAAAAPALEPLTIDTRKGEIAFEVEVADTEPARRVGLMNRDHLPVRQGMLFVFDVPEYASFWMRNTRISLDLLFIDTAGVIVRIAANAEPMSTDLIEAEALVAAVLEINGGLSEKLGIAVGDTVHHPALAATASQQP